MFMRRNQWYFSLYKSGLLTYGFMKYIFKYTEFIKCEINIHFFYQIIRRAFLRDTETEKKTVCIFFYNASGCYHITHIVFFVSFLIVLSIKRYQHIKYLQTSKNTIN